MTKEGERGLFFPHYHSLFRAQWWSWHWPPRPLGSIKGSDFNLGMPLGFTQSSQPHFSVPSGLLRLCPWQSSNLDAHSSLQGPAEHGSNPGTRHRAAGQGGPVCTTSENQKLATLQRASTEGSVPAQPNGEAGSPSSPSGRVITAAGEDSLREPFLRI